MNLDRPPYREPAGWPLGAPGMPPPGPDFVAQAIKLGDRETHVETKGKTADRRVTAGAILQQLYDRALRTPGFDLQVAVRGGSQVARFLPGHIWNQHAQAFAQSLLDPRIAPPPVDGPHRADVMLIGKMPWTEESHYGRNFVGPSGEALVASIERMRVRGAEHWYITNLLKFMPPDGQTTILANWLKDCLPILHAELRIVQPRAILCLGADAAKAVLGKGMTLGYLDGRVIDWKFPLHQFGEPELFHHCAVMAVLHPVEAAKAEDKERVLDRGIVRFGMLARGERFDKAEDGVDHRAVDTWEDALAWANAAAVELLALPLSERIVAWDAEWHGKNPRDPHGYLRSVQCSWAAKKGVVFRLRKTGGEPNFVDAQGQCAQAMLFELLDKFCQWTECRSVGHFFNADLEWLVEYGFDPTRYCKVPLHDAADGTPAWQLLRDGNGWLDTAMMVHAVEETAALGLEALSSRYTQAPRYDIPLEDWKAKFCSDNDLKRAQLDGYGEAPEEVINGVDEGPAEGYGRRLGLSYSIYDSDTTRRICVALLSLLDSDYQGFCSWEPCWESMIALPVILEMKRTGILLDQIRMRELTTVFSEARTAQAQKLKDWANWPEFNPASVYHARELLFGEELNGKDWISGQPVRIRPQEARSARIEPLLDTGKPPRAWADVVAEGLERQTNPSTAKGVLGIMAVEYVDQSEPISLLRDFRFLDQVVKSVLRPPLADADVPYEDDDGNLVYDGGLAGSIDSDGRVRTTLSPTAETGRWKSWRPNLQNVSKTRDEDYARMLGDAYSHKLRSLFVASPGCALIEFDYTGAELGVMAFVSGDATMTDHVRRANLPENDPDYYDIHSNVAVTAFRLDCPPTKRGLKKAGVGHFRNLAKCVAAGSWLHTSGGLLRIEDLVGNRLKPEHGKRYRGGLRVANHVGETPLVATYNGGTKPCLKVTTERGYLLENTYEHQYLTVDNAGSLVFKRAGDLKLGDWVGLRTKLGPFGNDDIVPRPVVSGRTSHKPIYFPEKFTEDWASFLGLFVAEGNANPVSGLVQLVLADEKDPEFADLTEQMLRRLFGARLQVSRVIYEKYQNQRRFAISSVDLARWLISHFVGNSHTMQIPDFVSRWPQQLLRPFLSWMFEGDGSAKTNTRNFGVNYSTASRALADQLKQLLLLFGVTVQHAEETREGYDGTYHVLTVFSNRSRERFVREIGFVTEAKRGRCNRVAAFLCDRRVVPNQLKQLRCLLPVVAGPTKEKCRECVRDNNRVNLNPSRLKLILGAVVSPRTKEQEDAYRHLCQLPVEDVEFQRVGSLVDVGNRQVYDVQTTDEFAHLVTYNGLLTHQSVIFGLAYGRGAKAIALQARENRKRGEPEVTVDDAQAVVDGVFAMYPALVPFFDEAKRRATDERWEAQCFGRRRRVPRARDRGTQGEFERQFMNFLIQGPVASMVDRGLANLQWLRDAQLQQPDLFRLLLQIHDAGIVEAPYRHVGYVAKVLIPAAMCEAVPIWPTDLAGEPTGKGPYRLGLDVTVMPRWGEKYTLAECERYGIPTEFADRG